jgi:hypothetical protein
MGFDSLPEGWTVWNDEPGGRGILAYRPDVFDASEFPAPCMPTIFVSDKPRHSRSLAPYAGTDTWTVVLYLEPEIEGPTESYDSREEATEGAVALARRFAAGEIDYRSLYQVPREEYFEKLDELTGRSG